MSDQMRRKGIAVDVPKLEALLDTKVVLTSMRESKGIEALKQQLVDYKKLSVKPCLDLANMDPTYFESLQKTFPKQSLYKLWLVITQDVNFSKLDRQKVSIEASTTEKLISSLINLENELKELKELIELTEYNEVI